jgi:multidrug resistance efflux pump
MKRPLWMPLTFLALAALGLVAIALTFSVNQKDWASTDNAELTAPTYAVMAPQSGRITSWTSHLPGSRLALGDAIGTVAGAAGGMVLRAPHKGWFVGDYAYQGDIVAQGQQVALVADLSQAYVLAYVDEGRSGSLHVGEIADMRFANAPNTLVVGHVQRILPAVASIVWPVPTLTQGQAFSRQSQWVPVRIALPRSDSVLRYLGMSVSVRIAIGGGGS